MEYDTFLSLIEQQVISLDILQDLEAQDRMGVGKGQEGKMAPVHFFSHGSTMMLGEDSASARYWEKMGDEAIKNGVEHVVIMVSA